MGSKRKTLVGLLIFGLAIFWGGFNIKPAKATENWSREFITNGDFESADTSMWYEDKNVSEVPGQIIMCAPFLTAHSGSCAAWVGGTNDDWTLRYPHDWLTSESIGDLSAADRVVFSYYYHLVTEDLDNSDNITVDLMDADTWLPLQTTTYYSNTDKTSDYVIGSMDVTAYKTYNTYLRFQLNADGSDVTSFYVDDVQVTAYYNDTVGPVSGSVVINSMNASTTSTNVTLSTSATDSVTGVETMRFSNDNSNWSGWYDYASSHSWTLPAGQGTKTVYAQYRDNVGNISNSVSDSIVYDPNGPSGRIKINNGARSTTKAKVTLNLSASDLSGVSQMRFSNNGRKWSGWKTYSKKYKKWDMTKRSYGGNSRKGKKRVYVQFKDTLGNVSIKKLDTITYR